MITRTERLILANVVRFPVYSSSIAGNEMQWHCRTNSKKAARYQAAFSYHVNVMKSVPVETVEVHNFGPRSNKVLNELLFRVLATIDFRERA